MLTSFDRKQKILSTKIALTLENCSLEPKVEASDQEPWNLFADFLKNANPQKVGNCEL